MSSKKCLVYITAFIPFGTTESFVLEEILLVKEYCPDILIIPRNPPKAIFHNEARSLEQNALWLPLFNGPIIFAFLKSLFTFPVWKIMASLVLNSSNIVMAIKNMVVLPKSVYLANKLKEKNVCHIHAHWASTTTTMAYIIHRLTGIPYSITMHRWDIYANNMLGEKLNLASFARCISQKGKHDVLVIAGRKFDNKVHVIHMGVELPDISKINVCRNNPLTIMTAANLLPVKGHCYMIEACRILKDKGMSFRYWIVGNGPLEKELKGLVHAQKLNGVISFLGRLPHDKVMEMYHKREVDLVVLPSINTANREHEGIPVALVEAMSFAIPVVTTSTGSIPELMAQGGGIMVTEKDGQALAEAIQELANDSLLYERLAREARAKIEKDFSGKQCIMKLLKLFELGSGVK